MSMLLGPLSETISSVSWRDCALAGDQIAGAETALPAASAVMDLRKSRRCMEELPGGASMSGVVLRKCHASREPLGRCRSAAHKSMTSKQYFWRAGRCRGVRDARPVLKH